MYSPDDETLTVLDTSCKLFPFNLFDQIHAPLVMNYFGLIDPVAVLLVTTTFKGLKIQNVSMLLAVMNIAACKCH